MTTLDEPIARSAADASPMLEPRAAASDLPESSRALQLFFALSAKQPRLMRWLRPAMTQAAVWWAPKVVDRIADNGRHISGAAMRRSESRRMARRVLGHFYDVVVDLAAVTQSGHDVDSLRQRIADVHGLREYELLRRQRRGAVLVTAHMGSFEIGLAALRTHEPNVHVVFKRDPFERFESIRTQIHSQLGVHEAPIDDGLASMMKLRDALASDHVVVIQADRAMPGQRALAVPVLHGRMNLPLGPAKLARLTQSPIVPVFVIRRTDGRFDIHLLPAIEVDDACEAAMSAIGNALGKFISSHAEQWLRLDRAFVD